MTVTVRQIKNKDGTVTSDVNGVLRVLKKKLMKDGFFQELRERSYFTSKGEKKRKIKFWVDVGISRKLRRENRS